MLPSYADTEFIFSQEVLCKLRAALHLPATNPHVARWLFAYPLHAFHPYARLLPPEVFENALSVRMSLDYKDFMSNTNPFAHPFPMYGDLSPPNASTSSASLNMLLIPAAHVSDLVLGYSIITSTNEGPMLNPFEVPLDTRPFVRERFCFDPSARHMVIVLNALSDTVTGIVSVEWLDDNRRQRLFFTVPNEEYGFYNLPSKVLAIMTHTEHKIADDSSEISTAHSDDEDGPSSVSDAGLERNDVSVGDLNDAREEADMVLGGVTADMLSGLDDLLGLSGGGSIFEDPMDTVVGNSTEERITNRRDSGAIGTSNGMGAVSRNLAKGTQLAMKRWAGVDRGERASVGPFSMKDLFSALTGLEGILKGRFYAPNLSRDVLDPSTGEILSRTSGEMIASLTKADGYTFKAFKDATVQTYYANALAVSTDRMLTYPGEKRNSRRIGLEREVEKRKRSRVGAGRVKGKGDEDENSEEGDSDVRATDTLTKSGDDMAGEQERASQDVEAIKAARLEARKQRNRESAARSNQRKKERVAAEERELERLKVRLKELRETKQKLEVENERLKHRLI